MCAAEIRREFCIFAFKNENLLAQGMSKSQFIKHIRIQGRYIRYDHAGFKQLIPDILGQVPNSDTRIPLVCKPDWRLGWQA